MAQWLRALTALPKVLPVCAPLPVLINCLKTNKKHICCCCLEFFFFNLFYLFIYFQDRVSLCDPGGPRGHSVDQVGLKLRNPPASASWVLGLKSCAPSVQLNHFKKQKQNKKKKQQLLNCAVVELCGNVKRLDQPGRKGCLHWVRDSKFIWWLTF